MAEPTFALSRDRPLATARLLLRPYAPDEAAHLHELFGREEVSRYLPWPPMDLAQATAKLQFRVRQDHLGPDQEAMVPLAIEAATGSVIGEFMLRIRSWERREGEVGWSLRPEFHGRGYATEGARELLRIGFEELGLHRIQAGADPRNVASLRVMERLGMRREAHFVQSELVKGEWVDEVVYALLDTEWQVSRA